MSEGRSDLRRILESGGAYAVAGAAQQALAFLLLPVYTRFIPPDEYGRLELLLVFSTLFFGLLALGMPSAIVKCFHRDCETDAERDRVLGTAFSLSFPIVLAGAGAAALGAPWLAKLLVAEASAAGDLRLALAYGVCANAIALLLSMFRAREQARAFIVLSLVQVATALALNLVLVVVFDLGIRGVLWGNLISTLVALPIGWRAGSQREVLAPAARLVAPMLRFGLLLVPVTFAGWIAGSSDRYVLRIFDQLSDVAVYSIGYKVGMVMEIAIVWPFQLAWPAVAFSISKREGHEHTYARTLLGLAAALVLACVGLSVAARLGLPFLLGADYALAYRVVPWVALAYAFNGVQYCVSPGIHVEDRTRFLTLIAIGTAVLNLALNFALIPSFGMLGAAAATTLAFGAAAAVTFALSQKLHPVPYDTIRLLALAGAGVVAGGVVLALPASGWSGIAGQLLIAGVLLPLTLAVIVFSNEAERDALRAWWARYRRPTVS